jgi:hypothetical protein
MGGACFLNPLALLYLIAKLKRLTLLISIIERLALAVNLTSVDSESNKDSKMGTAISGFMTDSAD